MVECVSGGTSDYMGVGVGMGVGVDGWMDGWMGMWVWLLPGARGARQ